MHQVAERHRALTDEQQATQRKLALKPRSKGADLGAGTGRDQDAKAEAWDRTFHVYPYVEPPPEEHVQDLGRLPEDVVCGRMEVIIGKYFACVFFSVRFLL